MWAGMVCLLYIHVYRMKTMNYDESYGEFWEDNGGYLCAMCKALTALDMK